MGKIIVFITVLGFSTLSNHVYSQTKFGIKAGLNVSNISQNFKVSDLESDSQMKAGFQIGVLADISLSNQLGLQTGLVFTSKGFRMEYEDIEPFDGEADGNSKFRYNYFEIPINLALKIGDFQVFAGPYAALGLGGKGVSAFSLVQNGEIVMEVNDEFNFKPVFGEYDPRELDDKESAFNALDYGFNFGFGYQIGPILLNAGYSVGLGNLIVGRIGDDFNPANMKTSHRVLTFSASYFF